ncbi:CRISPR-associated endonuclease Cas2 [bacterium]|nr:CRISPR-associated endonuclease Cas2 [bacterium]
MRLFVFFDLPVTEKKDRKIATKFRQELLDEGFTMLQFSVYCRVCRGYDIVEREIRRIKQFLPPKGNIRILNVTEKQYESMKFLVGSPKKEEKIGAQQLLLF